VVKHPRSGCNGLERSHRDALSADRADGVASVHIRPPNWRGTAGPLQASMEADDSPMRRDATDAVAIRRMFHVKHSRRCFGSLVLPRDIGCAVRAVDLLRSSPAEDSHQVCASRGRGSERFYPVTGKLGRTEWQRIVERSGCGSCAPGHLECRVGSEGHWRRQPCRRMFHVKQAHHGHVDAQPRGRVGERSWRISREAGGGAVWQ